MNIRLSVNPFPANGTYVTSGTTPVPKSMVHKLRICTFFFFDYDLYANRVTNSYLFKNELGSKYSSRSFRVKSFLDNKLFYLIWYTLER